MNNVKTERQSYPFSRQVSKLSSSMTLEKHKNEIFGCNLHFRLDLLTFLHLATAASKI